MKVNLINKKISDNIKKLYADRPYHKYDRGLWRINLISKERNLLWIARVKNVLLKLCANIGQLKS